jgi:hypothetical protein
VQNQTSKLASALFATPVAKQVAKPVEQAAKTPLPSFASELDFLDSIHLIEKSVEQQERVDSAQVFPSEPIELEQESVDEKAATLSSTGDSDSEESIHASPREAARASAELAAHDEEQEFADQVHQVESFLAKVTDSLDTIVKQE